MKLYKQNIQVKGRRLYLEGIGIIIIKLANRQFIFLENNLFVPKLGYIFVSAKKLVRNQLISQFDCYQIQFLSRTNSNLIIKASIKRDLYIITNILSKVNR
jgi:hypothetical protein